MLFPGRTARHRARRRPSRGRASAASSRWSRGSSCRSPPRRSTSARSTSRTPALDDQVADLFEITFNGGAAGHATHRAADRHRQDWATAWTIGDTFFDTAPGGLGAYGSSPFDDRQPDGIDSVTRRRGRRRHAVGADVQRLRRRREARLQHRRRRAGLPAAQRRGRGRRVRRLDADRHVHRAALLPTPPAPTSSSTPTTTNSPAPGLNLPNDNYNAAQPLHAAGLRAGPVYTAGAIFPLQQTPLPITLSGTVFEDSERRQPAAIGRAGHRRRAA